MDKNVIKGVYIPQFRYGPRLELVGPFDRKSIEEVIQKQIPIPYAFSPKEQERPGTVVFLIDDERAASSLVRKLNNSLSTYNLVIEYNPK